MSRSLTANSCPRDSFYIKFYPELQRQFGSRNVPLIVGRLEFWFSNPKFKNGFFKFLEPCRHYLYKNGDSWSEELGVSRILFNKAFDLIGIRYKSKADFLSAPDPFQGKLYASYYHRKTNKMFYVRNHAFVDDFFQSLFPSKKTAKVTDKKGGGEGRSISQTPPPQPIETSQKNDSENRSRNSINNRSFINKDSTKKTNILLKATQNFKGDEEDKRLKIREDMIHIWKEEVGEYSDKTVVIPRGVSLSSVLTSHFKGCLDNWRHYCRTIGSSRFLTGKVTNFRAWIVWALKGENINRIQNGDFSVWDQTPPMLVKTKHQDEVAYQTRLRVDAQIEKEKETLRLAISDIQRKRFAYAESFFDRLPDSVRQTLQQTYAEQQFIDPNDIITKMYHRQGWSGIPKYMIVRDYAANNEKIIFKRSEREEIKDYALKHNLLRAYKAWKGGI